MTTAGWLIMGISIGAVCLLLCWCVYKIVSTPNETEHIHGFEQETPDMSRDTNDRREL